MMPGVLALSPSLRLACPWITAHALTTPATASGVSSSAPEPTLTQTTLVKPAQDHVTQT